MLRSAGRVIGGFVSRYRIPLVIAAAALVVLIAVPLVVAAVAPGYFFGSYHDVSQNYEEMQTSLHAEVACRHCHAETQGPVVYGATLVGEFYANLVSPADEPRFLDFETPARGACLACHETVWSHEAERVARVPHPAHMQVANESRECVECHKWTAHEETYMEEHKEMPFSGICVAYGCHVGFRPEDQCTSCHHALRDETEDWLVEHPRVAQTIGTNSCLETCHDADQCRLCHTTGERPEFDGLQTQTGLEAIERLHVAADWSETHGPTALADESKCMQCHVSDGECRACHAQRPASHDPVETWISSHKEVVDPDDEVRCMTCHERSWCDECHELFEESG
jgi:hypothetical protein